jgi:hypothetical protein
MGKFTEKITKIFAMMAITKNIPIIELNLDTSKMSPLELASAANIVKTLNDPLAGNPPVTDNITHGQASTLETTFNATQTKPPTMTTAQVKVAFKALSTTYKKVGAYVQGVSNDAAISSGDVQAGILVAIRCGFKIKKEKTINPRQFKAKPGVGCVDISTKAVAKRAIYIRQYGPATAKGVAPTTPGEYLISFEADIHINNLKSVTVYAFREATLIPPKRTKKPSSSTTTTTTTVVAKTATPTVATTSHKVTFTDGVEHYNFGDWIFAVTQ